METLNQSLSKIQLLMRLTYGIVPIVAGADKFTNLLAKWTDYLHPILAGILPMSGSAFMMIVGVIEIIAGILVLVNPAKGAYVVSVWLVLIAVNLLSSGHYLDVAVRDLVMAVGAYSLAKISGLIVSN